MRTFLYAEENTEVSVCLESRVDLAAVREALRRARAMAPIERKGVPRVGMTLDEAAKKSGLNRATIHSIENVKREPLLRPELETIERLAAAYGLTLSSLFARIEAIRNRDGSTRVAAGGGADGAQKGTASSTGSPSKGSRDAEDRPISPADRHALFQEFAIWLSLALADAATKTDTDDRPLPKTRPRKTRGR